MDGLIYFIVVGIVAGWLAGQFVKGSSFGLVGDLIVGVIGAVLGGFLFRMVGLAATGLVGQIVVSTVGAVVLLVGMRYLNKK